MACSPRLGWKKSAPPRTYITAVLHFKILVAVSRGSAWRSMRCATTSGTPARASKVAVVKRSFLKHVSPEAVEPRQHRVEVEFRRGGSQDRGQIACKSRFYLAPALFG